MDAHASLVSSPSCSLSPVFKTRVLSDYLSGRTDRVVAEWEAEGLADIENGMNTMMENPDAQKWFEGWFKKLTELIDHAEVENWTVE